MCYLFGIVTFMRAHLRKTESELPESSGIDTWSDAEILGAFVAGQERAIAAVLHKECRERTALRLPCGAVSHRAHSAQSFGGLRQRRSVPQRGVGRGVCGGREAGAYRLGANPLDTVGAPGVAQARAQVRPLQCGRGGRVDRTSREERRDRPADDAEAEHDADQSVDQ